MTEARYVRERPAALAQRRERSTAVAHAVPTGSAAGHCLLLHKGGPMALALELAHRITSQRFADLPSQAVHWAKVGILDTVGTTLAGCHEDTACLAARALASGTGPSLLFGHRRRVPALEAALVNGAASHALDFDDCNNTIGGQPSAPGFSAPFVLADG